MVLVLKIKWQEEFRRLSLQKNPTFRELVNQLRDLFHLPTEILVVKYVDEEQDLITITSDLEWSEAIRFYVEQQISVLKLFLHHSLMDIPQGISPLICEPDFEDNEKGEEKKEEIQEMKEQKPQEIIAKKEEKKEKEEEKKEEMKVEKPQEIVVTSQPEIKKKEEVIAAKPEVKKEEEVAEKDEFKDLYEDALPSTVESSSSEDEEDEEALNCAIELEKHKPILKEFKARRGNSVLIDVARESVAAFGLEPNDRVNTPGGPGQVVGRGHIDGHLWFKLERDSGVSFWDDIKTIDDLWCKGITLLPREFDAPRAPIMKNQQDVEADELKMLQRAIEESILDQQQKQIQFNFKNFHFNSNGRR